MDEESSLGAAADAIEQMMTEEPTQTEPNHANESEPKAEKAETETEQTAETLDELVDLDLEGTTYSLPKPLHEHLAELKKQTMLEKDYRQKTTTLAEEKRAWEEAKQKEIDAAAEAKAAQYKNELEAIRLMGAPPPDPSLLDSDPVEYLKQKDKFDKAQAAQRASEAEATAKHQAYVQEQSRKLMEANPEWSDPAVYSREMGSIIQYLKSTGASDKDIGDIADHRIFLIARDAARYHALQSKNTEVTKKIHKTPVKVERPGVPSGTDGQLHRDAMARLKKSGSIDDAAAAIMALS